MNVEHHVSDDLLLAYAAGTTEEATSILVATHLALCHACRSRLALAEAVGGALIDGAPADPACDKTMLEIIMRDHEWQESVGATVSPGPTRHFLLPQPLRDYAGGDVTGLRWRAIGGGIRHFPLETGDSDTTARLLSIPAGTSVPDHGHRGFEATLVLAGSFYDRGSWYRRGDVGIANTAVVHRPVAGPEEDCICLAVTEAPLKFQALIPRLLQPFHGI